MNGSQTNKKPTQLLIRIYYDEKIILYYPGVNNYNIRL